METLYNSTKQEIKTHIFYFNIVDVKYNNFLDIDALYVNIQKLAAKAVNLIVWRYQKSKYIFYCDNWGRLRNYIRNVSREDAFIDW